MSSDLHSHPDLHSQVPVVLDLVHAVPDASDRRYLQAAYAWAETEIAEWLSEADEEASAIIERARAEALRLELTGYEELERLRDEAVRVRMAAAERVAGKLEEARAEADQVLAQAGAEAERVVDGAKAVLGDLLEEISDLRAVAIGAAGPDSPAVQLLIRASTRLEQLFPSMLSAGAPPARLTVAPAAPPARLTIAPAAPPPVGAGQASSLPQPATTASRPAVKYFPDEVVPEPRRPGWVRRLVGRVQRPA